MKAGSEPYPAALGQDRAHFVQSFSIDGGRTWEDNWVLDLGREG